MVKVSEGMFLLVELSAWLIKWRPSDFLLGTEGGSGADGGSGGKPDPITEFIKEHFPTIQKASHCPKIDFEQLRFFFLQHPPSVFYPSLASEG